MTPCTAVSPGCPTPQVAEGAPRHRGLVSPRHPTSSAPRVCKERWRHAFQLGLASLVLGLALGALLYPTPSPGAPLQDQQILTVAVNKSRILDLREPIARVSVANPAIADILVINPKQVYVNGKELGSTNMILWGDPTGGEDVLIDCEAERRAALMKRLTLYRLRRPVEIAPEASIWCNVVVRAESQKVLIGRRTNIQDFVMIHVGSGTPTIVGENCSITHHVTLHGCDIGDNCLIGIGATIMDGCVIGAGSIVAGGSFLKEGTVIPANSIVMGSPGVATKTRDNSRANALNAFLYWRNAQAYAQGFYEKLGFVRTSDEFDDGGIMHVEMKLAR